MFTCAAIVWSQSALQGAFILYTRVLCDWSAEMKLQKGLASFPGEGTLYIHKNAHVLRHKEATHLRAVETQGSDPGACTCRATSTDSTGLHPLLHKHSFSPETGCLIRTHTHRLNKQSSVHTLGKQRHRAHKQSTRAFSL